MTGTGSGKTADQIPLPACVKVQTATITLTRNGVEPEPRTRVQTQKISICGKITYLDVNLEPPHSWSRNLPLLQQRFFFGYNSAREHATDDKAQQNKRAQQCKQLFLLCVFVCVFMGNKSTTRVVCLACKVKSSPGNHGNKSSL